MNISSESIIRAISNTVVIPDEDGIIYFSPTTLVAAKYSEEVSRVLELCSVQCSLCSLHRRGKAIGLSADYDDYEKAVMDLYKKGYVSVDGGVTDAEVMNVYKIPEVIPSPKSATVHITSKCNLKCIYCYNEEYRIAEKDKELSTEEWVQILQKIYDADVKVVIISGGEPLLRMDVIRAIYENKCDKVTYQLITNATLITEKNIKIIRELFSNGITLSIDSYNTEIADMLRGKGTQNAVVKAISLMKKNKMLWDANVVLTKYNIGHYEKTYNWLKKLNCRNIAPVIQSFTQMDDPSNCSPSVSQIEEFLDKRYYDILESNERCDVHGEIGDTRPTHVSKKYTCSAAIAECAVGSKGFIYPCRTLMHAKTRSKQSLAEASFRHIWQNDEVLNELRENVRIPDACKDCEFYMVCAGDCHGHRLLSDGEISKSVSLKHCTVYKQRIAKALIANVRHAERTK